MSLESLDRAVRGTIDLSVGDIIAKYGDKQAILMAVQKGEIKDSTKAVMAGMAIDRIAANAIKPPTSTVAEDTFPTPQPVPQTGAGLDQIPVPEQMFSAPQGMAGGGIVAFQSAGFVQDRRLLSMMNGQERSEYQVTGKIPERLQRFLQSTSTPVATFSERAAQPAGISTAGGMTDPIFGMGEQPAAPTQAQINESIIAQAQRGEGPNVHRPAAPADVAVVPPDGPVIPRPTGLETKAVPVVKKPEGDKKPLSIFDEAKNAADKLNAYKTQFGISGEDPDAAMRDKLKELQEGTKAERREAAYMAMIMAGLGIAGGTSPYFAANLKEAIPALKEYGVAKRDIKKAEMEYTKMETELNRSAEARKRGDMELALRLEESAADRELRLRQVVAAERSASKRSQLGELIDLATGGDRTKAAEYAQGVLKGKSGPKPMSEYERARLEQMGMKNASDEIRNNRQISRLANSKDPKDKAEAERLRNEIIAKHMQSASGRSNLGGATFLGYEE
jgi:hypothetical protein